MDWATREQYDELAASVAGRWVRDAGNAPGVPRQRVADAFMDKWALGRIGIQVQVQGNFTVILLRGPGGAIGVGAAKRRPEGKDRPDAGGCREVITGLCRVLAMVHAAVVSQNWLTADVALVNARAALLDVLPLFVRRSRVGDPEDGDIGIRAALPHAIRAALDGWKMWLEVPESLEEFPEPILAGGEAEHFVPLNLSGHRIADPRGAAAEQMNAGNPGADSGEPF